MKHEHEITPADAVRLLSNAAYKVHTFELTQEGDAPLCKNIGELILQDALFYLAYGDTRNARTCITIYEAWATTGSAPWPYDSDKGPDPVPTDADDTIPF